MSDARRRIALTGASGYLGEALLDRLTRRDDVELVAAIDLTPPLGPEGETRRYMSVVRDVRESIEDTLRDFEVDTVIHGAFLLRTHRDETYARAVNIESARRIAGESKAAGVKQIIYPGSTTVYGAYPGDTHFHTEDEEPSPLRGFQYSNHKREAEEALRREAEGSGLSVCILRSCVVMGPGADNFIAEALSMPLLPAPTGSNPQMQFLHVDDYCSAVEAALERDACGTFNIAGTGTVSWREMAALSGARTVPIPAPLLSAVIGITWSLRLQHKSPPSSLDLIRFPWLASTEKARAGLGWEPAYSSREALEAWINA